MWHFSDVSDHADDVRPRGQSRLRLSAPHRNAICHFFIRAGKLDYCGDSTHVRAGQMVDMPEWPYAEGEYGGV
jgi:hypothetical protein